MHEPVREVAVTAPPLAPRAGSGRFAGATLGAAVVCLAMIGGMFFDWATSIMPALAELDDRTFVVVMAQTIETINAGPLFLLAFAGVPVFGATAVVLLYRLRAFAAAWWVVGGLACYLVAVVVTGVVHVPINDLLAAADPAADPAAVRAATEGPWVVGHVVRTVATTLALAAWCRALLLAHRRTEPPAGRPPGRAGAAHAGDGDAHRGRPPVG